MTWVLQYVWIISSGFDSSATFLTVRFFSFSSSQIPHCDSTLEIYLARVGP